MTPIVPKWLKLKNFTENLGVGGAL